MKWWEYVVSALFALCIFAGAVAIALMVIGFTACYVLGGQC